MQKFLDQFGLTPMQRVDFESFIFTQADRMVDGYCGGSWETKDVGDLHILVIPSNSEKISLTNYAFGGGVDTDTDTASAAFSAIVANWYMGLRYEQGRLSDAAIESFAAYADKLRDVVYSKTQNVKLNQSDFFSFTD